MAAPEIKAAYKKKDGIFIISETDMTISWTPQESGRPGISLVIANISNLQRTPDSAAKVMLKIFEKPPTENGEAAAYSFHFTSPNARPEVNQVTELLQRMLQDLRSKDPQIPQPTAGPDNGSTNGQKGGSNDNAAPGSGSAAMSFASAATAKPAQALWFDDQQLLRDKELQTALLKQDTHLFAVFQDAVASKPSSLSLTAFSTQFWSTRTNLLRAYAIEVNQRKGAYNVLSMVKPRTVDGELKLNISVEQVQMIFNQHPLVKRIYNENVPKLSEAEFWSRFFLSRLSKKLRGERVTDSDNTDPLFDKYNEADDTAVVSRIMSAAVPNIIDLEGNEENQGGFRSGNRKDVEMRPRSNIPIVKTLNSLSEKIMANVAPSDPDMYDQATAEAETFSHNLSLRDLQDDAEASRIILNVKEQSRFFSGQDSAPSTDTHALEKQVPSEVLFDVQADLDTLADDGSGGIDLHKGLGVGDEGDESGSDEEAATKRHVGSRLARRAAQAQVLKGLGRRRAEAYGHKSGDTTPMGIPAEITARAQLTNATTNEFLQQFWKVFLSGDAERALDLGYYADSLKRSMQRIEAVAEEAERARQEVIKKKAEEARAHHQRTGRKPKFKPSMIDGGSKAVLVLMKPTIVALEKAQGLYADALRAEGIQPSTET